jgi:Protein of unknown function (DUF2971)
MVRLAQGHGRLLETAVYTNAEKGLPWDELFNSRGKYVFHYTKLDTALRHILWTGRLRLSPYAKTNDPRESKDWEFTYITEIPSRVSESVWGELTDRANAIGKRVCRVLCTTQDEPERQNPREHISRGYCHPRMWAQYAEGHSGVCLVLDKALLNSTIEALSPSGQVFSGEVHYADRTKEDLEAFDLDYSKIMEDGIETVMKRKLETYHQTYFFRKARDWQQEQEYRWVMIGDASTPEYLDVDIFQSLIYIIVGMEYAEAYYPSLAFICEEREIPIGHLIWRSGQPFFYGCMTSALFKAVYRSRSCGAR